MRLFLRHQKGVTEVTDRNTLREGQLEITFLFGSRPRLHLDQIRPHGLDRITTVSRSNDAPDPYGEFAADTDFAQQPDTAALR
jgi:hypothetical protein